MAENKPESNPVPPSGIPVGKLVGDRAPPRVKSKSDEHKIVPPAVPVVGPAPVVPPAEPNELLGGDFDVELIAIPCAPPKPVKPRDQRSLFEPDRRDFIMLGAGVGATVAAVLVGLLAAKAFQSKPAENKSNETDSKPKSGSHDSEGK